MGACQSKPMPIEPPYPAVPSDGRSIHSMSQASTVVASGSKRHNIPERKKPTSQPQSVPLKGSKSSPSPSGIKQQNIASASASSAPLPVDSRRLWLTSPTSANSDFSEELDENTDPSGPYGSENTMPSVKSIKDSLLSPSVRHKSATDTIPEEEDPEMPSDEEDFREEMTRNTPKDEPGRLVPVKLKTIPTTSVNSVGVADTSNIPIDEKNAVQMHTLSQFQRLKLQVKLQKHQELKDRRVNKVETRIQDVEAQKKLWMEYQKAEQELAAMEESMRRKARSDSFDLKDSGSWFFDFSSVSSELGPGGSVNGNGDDQSSRASLSLLSEQSLEAQRRYYAEKRRRRKEKRKNKKNKPNGPGARRAMQRSQSGNLSASSAPEARLSSQPARDYGPVRIAPVESGPSHTLEWEVSILPGGRGGAPVPVPDETGSLVSDLGDESYTGNNSLTGPGGSVYSYASNDYGVKRRRPHPPDHHDHESLQAKIQSLENAIAQMQAMQNGEDDDIYEEKKEEIADPDQEAEAVDGTLLSSIEPYVDSSGMVEVQEHRVLRSSSGDEDDPITLNIDHAAHAPITSEVYGDAPTQTQVSLPLEECPPPSTTIAPSATQNPNDSLVDHSDLLALREAMLGPSSAGDATVPRFTSMNSIDTGVSFQVSSPANTPKKPTLPIVSPCTISKADRDSTAAKLFHEPSPVTVMQGRPEKNDSANSRCSKNAPVRSNEKSSITVMSTDDFLRMSYGNALTDIAVFRQEVEDIPSDEESVQRPETPPRETISYRSPKPDSSFWSDQMDRILLKNFIPEKTNAIRDDDIPRTQNCKEVSIITPSKLDSPDTSPTSSDDSTPRAIEPEEHEIVGQKPDPEGSRIDSGKRQFPVDEARSLHTNPY